MWHESSGRRLLHEARRRGLKSLYSYWVEMKNAIADIRVRRFASSTHRERFDAPIEGLMMLPIDYSWFEAAVSCIDENLASKCRLRRLYTIPFSCWLLYC